MLKCLTCQTNLVGKQTKFCSVECKHKSTNVKHQNYECQKDRGEKNKLKLLQLFNTECSKCGYNKNYAALCFHHLRDKNFGIDVRKCSNTKWENLVEESKKCIVLCHNCHMEEHYPQNKLS